MVLSDVWGYLNEDLKRVFRSAVQTDERIDSQSILDALVRLPDDHPVGQLIRGFDEEYDLNLDPPGELPAAPDPVPEYGSLSPAVREALQFFRMHKIRSVDVTDYTRRLLQIGSGDTVRRLEKQGILRKIIDQLESDS